MSRYHATSEGRIKYTAEEETARDAEEAQAVIDANAQADLDATEASKQTGIEILGVMCSARGRDQDKLAAIALGVMMARAGGPTFPDTKFGFVNGSELIITASNFDAIYAIWMPFRQSFFTA